MKFQNCSQNIKLGITNDKVSHHRSLAIICKTVNEELSRNFDTRNFKTLSSTIFLTIYST